MYVLLKNNIKFDWGKEQELVFNNNKESIASIYVLVHYNTDWELIFASYVSPIDIGAILSH